MRHQNTTPIWHLQTPIWTHHSSFGNQLGPIQLIALVFENDHCFLVDPYLAQEIPALLTQYGKVIGRADVDGLNWCWVIARPKVKTNAKGAKRRKRLASRI